MASGDPRDEVAAALRQLLWKIGAHTRESARDNELSVARLATLRAIRDQPDPTPASVASETHLTRSTMTGVLDQLEKEGWITRERSASDRRRIALTLTRAGRAKARGLPDPIPDAVRAAIGGLEPGVRVELARSLELLVRAIEVPS